jgi:hypothetical protein
MSARQCTEQISSHWHIHTHTHIGVREGPNGVEKRDTKKKTEAKTKWE